MSIEDKLRALHDAYCESLGPDHDDRYCDEYELVRAAAALAYEDAAERAGDIGAHGRSTIGAQIAEHLRARAASLKP